MFLFFIKCREGGIILALAEPSAKNVILNGSPEVKRSVTECGSQDLAGFSGKSRAKSPICEDGF